MPSSSTVLEQSLDPHLMPVEPRERRKLAECGYTDTHATHELIRLACQARATGAVSIVIPPWTGVIGGAVARQALQEPAIAGAR